MNLLKQTDAEESEQKDKGKIVRVPSLKRKTSDKRNPPPKVIEIRNTKPLESVQPPLLSWTPLETIFSPVEKPAVAFQQFASGKVPEVLSSKKTEMKPERRLSETITPPTPKTVDPQATSLTHHSSLTSPLSPTPISLQRSSNFSESYATGLLSPQEKSAESSSFSNLQTKLAATSPKPDQKSFDKSPDLLLSRSSRETSETAPLVSPRDSCLSSQNC